MNGWQSQYYFRLVPFNTKKNYESPMCSTELKVRHSLCWQLVESINAIDRMIAFENEQDTSDSFKNISFQTSNNNNRIDCYRFIPFFSNPLIFLSEEQYSMEFQLNKHNPIWKIQPKRLLLFGFIWKISKLHEKHLGFFFHKLSDVLKSNKLSTV